MESTSVAQLVCVHHHDDTLGNKLPAFSASRQLTSDDAAAEGRRVDVASKQYSGVRAQRHKAIMRVIPQREPGGEL